MLGSDDEELFSNSTLKFLGVLFVVFVVIAFKSWEELRFRMSGLTAQAIVTHITPTHSKYGDLTGYAIAYDFDNANTKRKGHGESHVGVDEVSAFAVGNRLDIQYYGEKYPTTRFAGVSNWTWVTAFFITLVVLIATLGWLTYKSWREERDYKERHIRRF